MKPETLYCIANPRAARGKIQRQIQDVLDFFSRRRVPVQLLWTERPRHGVELARDLAASGVERLASIGGDGTAFEVINGLMQAKHNDPAVQTSLGLLPLGTGNSFLLDFSIRSWKDAAERILQSNRQAVDVGRITVHDSPQKSTLYFHNMMGWGLVAQACRLRHSRYLWMGRYAYHGAFFQLLFGMKTFAITLRANESDPITVRSPLCVLCNSQYTGHEMHLSPRSLVDDGKMELIYGESITARDLFHLFLSLASGKHLLHPKVKTQAVQSLDIEIQGLDYYMVDGDVANGSRFHI
ncbi:MAG: diacylglycerol/lipid kinase family protein, partial [Candidatus Hinthialibacter sp.]